MFYFGRMLFCGIIKGILWFMKFLLNVLGEWIEY